MLGQPESKAEPFAYALAVCLAALAGWVDATGFIAFGGLFVSFMSGNSTEAAVSIGVDPHPLFVAARAILAFVLGVVLGELAGGISQRYGRVLVLVLESLLLWLAAVAGLLAQPDAVVAALLGLAMGTQNASVHKAQGITLALTYVTGTLVHMGRAVAAALRGHGPWRAASPYLGLWLGLVLGGFAGALIARRAIHLAMLGAASIATALTLWSAVVAARRSR